MKKLSFGGCLTWRTSLYLFIASSCRKFSLQSRFIRLGSYFCQLSILWECHFFKLFLKSNDLTDWTLKSNDLTDWTLVGDWLQPFILQPLIQLACLDKQLVKTDYDIANMGNCGLCLWLLITEFYACHGLAWNGYLLPLLLWPGRVGLSHPTCSDALTSLSQQSSIHPHSFICDSLL